MKLEKHYINRNGWLRAAVLGMNEGIISTTSLVIGVAASNSQDAIVLAAMAGLIAGAFSMTAGEYVSVSSQVDIETADLAREKKELDTMADLELAELALLYQQRSVDKAVARQLTEYDALGAHARDELGINAITQTKPLQAALIYSSGGGCTLKRIITPNSNINTCFYLRIRRGTLSVCLRN